MVETKQGRKGRQSVGYILIAIAASLSFGPAPSQPASHRLSQRHFADEVSCKQAASALLPAPGTKMVCIAVDAGPVLQAAY